ncbi:MAG: acyl-ACP thioesterase domain-containing protein [Bacteroidota bacterium]
MDPVTRLIGIPVIVPLCDARGTMSIPSVVDYLHQAAWQSAVSLGAGVPDLMERGVSWVLQRMKLEIQHLPRANSRIDIHSWPSGRDRFFAYRDYRMFAENGALLVQATSTWVVFDLQTRNMIHIPDWVALPIDESEIPPSLPRLSGKIRFPEAVDYSQSFQPNWFDVDINQHVTNTRFFRWILETLPVDHLRTHTIAEVDLIFKQELIVGEPLVGQASVNGMDTFIHQLVRKNGSIAAIGSTKWREHI